MHVAVIGDFDRGDQALNVRKLEGLFAPVLRHCGVESSSFITKINEEKEISNWLPYWKSAILSNEVNWPTELKLSNLCVIGFEVPKKYLEFLSCNRVPWVNLAIHPLRFLDDLYFDVTTSFEFNLIDGAASDGLIFQSASVLRQRFPISASKLECNRLAIIGQTPIDKSVFFEGRFFNLLDYLPKIDKIAKKYKAVIYKPHPLFSDIDVDAKIVERYQAQIIEVKDTYEWLIRGEISEICGISSSLIHEAPFFNIKSTFLDNRASRFGSPISYKWLVENTQFWAEGLLGLSKVPRSQTHISSVTPKNFLRNTFGAWGYTRIDEDALKSNIDHLSWRLDNAIVNIEGEKNRADNLATERFQLAERVTAFESERSTLLAEKSALDTRLSTLATEREALNRELAAKDDALTATRELLAQERSTNASEKSTLEARLTALTGEHTELATRHALLATEREALSTLHHQVSTEREALNRELAAKDDALTATRELLAQERSTNASEKSTLEARLTALTGEHAQLQRECDAANALLEEAAEESAAASSESALFRRELSTSQNSLAATRELLETAQGTFAAERLAFESQRTALESEKSALEAHISALDARLSTLSSENTSLATRHQQLTSEHDALHQANHGHWQLSENLKQELAAKEQAWSEERSTLDSRLSSLLAEREALATSHSSLIAERDALLASTCWRITAPIRWMRGGVRIPWPAPNEPLDDFFLKHAALYIRRRPHLKERALRFLFQNPKWHARILPVLQGIKASKPSPQAAQPIPQPVQLLQPAPQPAPLLEVFPPHEPPAEIPSPPSEECSVAHSIQVAKSAPLPLIAAARPKILQLTNYSIEEPDHGGKLRCYNIREALREYFEVKTLPIEVSENDTVDDYSIGVCAKDLYAQIGDGCLQDWASAYYLIEKQNLWSSLRQIVLNFNPDAILLEQPFLFPVFKKLHQDGVLRKECILINSSHNNEVELKRGIYNQIFGKQKAVEKLDIVKQLESEATRAAHLSIAVSEQDLDYLKALSPDQPVLLYRNGHSGIKTTHAIQKWAEKFANSERNFIVVGSWHMPNILGLKRLVDAGLLSLDPKKTKLWVFGGMGPGLLSTFSLSLGESSPLEIIGQASSDDIDSAIMASSGVILPIWDGSGSNLKTAQALLSGKTIIGTNFAFRGLEAYSTESGVNITDDAAALLGAMRSVDISANHQRPQAVAHLRWDNLLKNLPQDVANVLGHPIERYKIASKLFFDITTLVRWKGHPTGIARVLSNLGSAMLAAYPDLQFTIFSSESGKFHHYDINQNQQSGAIHINSRDIIFSAGANWDDEGFEDAIIKAKQRGAQYSLLFYDAIPYLLPHSFGPGFADKFIPWLKKSIQLSDINFAISKNTRQDFIEFANAKSIKIAETTVIRLGDSMKSSHEMNQNSENEEKIRRREFILCVGTLEFRKNHIVLLNAYRLLLQSGVSNIPQLIIVGCQGWMDSDISIQVQNDKLIHGYIQVLSGVSDSELANLYKDCLFTVYPALYEGWGLPVSESLGYGKICITSRSSSMVEIAPHLTPFANPLAPEEWAEQISRLINNRELLAKESAKIASEYKLTKWATTAASVLKSLETFSLACHK